MQSTYPPRLPGRASWRSAPAAALAAALILAAASAASADEIAPALGHWAFRPLSGPASPEVRDASWPRTPVDGFILARLDAAGIEPAPRADRRQLLRRVAFDLTGLPPSPADADAFAADAAPDAYERLVDRFLASPRHGERWGRHWLDVARYADNKGYVFFEEKTFPWAWTYRDYVVRAFNEDKPFDRFVLEQLAADQLPLGGDASPLAALGFLTVGDRFSNNTHDILDDRIDVVTRGLLGLTVSCARCHAHKFDPISMADYYALYGVFRSSAEPMAPPLLGPPEASEVYERFDLELASRQAALRAFVESKHREIVEGARTRIAAYLETAHAQRHQPLADNFMLLADPGDLNPSVIHRWRVYLDRAPPADPVWAPWHAYAALGDAVFSAAAGGVNEKLMAMGAAALNPRVRRAFAAGPPAAMTDVARRYAELLDAAETEGRLLVAAGGAGASAAADPARDELLRVLHGPGAPPDVPAQMDWGFLSLLPDRASQGEFQKLLGALEGWLMHGPGAPPRAMTLEDLPVAYEPHVFLRGNPNRPGEAVPRRFLAALDPTERPFLEGSGRLELARAILGPGASLAARVLANRIWLHHFGAGLVATPSDFGRRSEPPTHPELLEWLAGELVRSDWSLKRFHRSIVTSAAYQQSSIAVSPRALAVDPENRLLGRGARRRHDFETLRDALLCAAGTLDLRLGGPAVGLSDPRRTAYTFRDRLDVPPVMTTFDVPSPSTSCPQRPATTVAPQALYLMNNGFVAECAAAALRRAEIAGAGVAAGRDRVAALHRLLFVRPAQESDQVRAAAFLGESPGAEAWERYVHALLMTNELVFVD